jgi:hypothetical protein
MEYKKKTNRVYRKRSSDMNDIVGQKLGHLTVLSYEGRKPYRGRYAYAYRCRCDCGTEIESVRSNIYNGHTTSCGCMKRRTGGNNPCWGGHGEISSRLWTHIRHQAQERKLPFKITIEATWNLYQEQGGLCALTGWPIELHLVKGRYSTRTGSLDRIDNTKGYITGNVQWVHKDVNWMKGRFRIDRFLELCRAVTAHEDTNAS